MQALGLHRVGEVDQQEVGLARIEAQRWLAGEVGREPGQTMVVMGAGALLVLGVGQCAQPGGKRSDAHGKGRARPWLTASSTAVLPLSQPKRMPARP